MASSLKVQPILTGKTERHLPDASDSLYLKLLLPNQEGISYAKTHGGGGGVLLTLIMEIGAKEPLVPSLSLKKKIIKIGIRLSRENFKFQT